MQDQLYTNWMVQPPVQPNQNPSVLTNLKVIEKDEDCNIDENELDEGFIDLDE